MLDPSVSATALQCRHYAMCKIDFLGLGLCPSGREHQFVSHWPQGRMDLVAALGRRDFPLTPRLVEIAAGCDLCGRCDLQCNFVTGLRPLAVMRALKTHVEERIAGGEMVVEPETDILVTEIRQIVGQQWSSNDPAVLEAYSNDPCPFSERLLPRCVVLPGSSGELAAVVNLCHGKEIPYALRGNGSSVIGLTMSPGVVIDTARMKEIVVDRETWSARIGPGVTAWELQETLCPLGLRANVAEPSAMVVANLICTGIFSTFSAAYGSAADCVLDGEFVTPGAGTFRLTDPAAPNLLAGTGGDLQEAICTSLTIRLHPVLADEQGVLAPFDSFAEAASFVRELNMRRIGLALAVLGLEYVSDFISPTLELTQKLKEFLWRDLGIKYLVLVVGDSHAIQSVRRMRPALIDNRLFRALALGLPRIAVGDLSGMFSEIEKDRPAWEFMVQPGMSTLVEAFLQPDPKTAASAVEPDLRAFYTDLYSRPEMTDLVRLNSHRILSSRMGREKHMLVLVLYFPLDRMQLIEEVIAALRKIAGDHDLKNEFGFLTPLDEGKRCILEYDYFFDHTSETESAHAKRAFVEAGEYIRALCRKERTVRWIGSMFNRGYRRMENFLYS